MAEEASAHDAFAEALSGGEAHAAEPTHGAPQDAAPQISQDAPQGGSEPEGVAQQPDGQELPQTPQERAQEAMVPSWRLREINEQREAERRQWQQEQRELAELKRYKEEQERQRQAEAETERLNAERFDFDNAAGYIDQRFDHRFQSGMRQALSPVQQEIEKLRQERQSERLEESLEAATEKFGQADVIAAQQWISQRVQANPEASRPLYDSIMSHRRPYAELMRLYREDRTLQSIGDGGLEAYNKRQQDELLKNPEFLARALEAHRQMATPVTTGVPGRAAPPQAQRTLPSLNRQTSSRDASGEGDVGDVFAQTIAERGRRAG